MLGGAGEQRGARPGSMGEGGREFAACPATRPFVFWQMAFESHPHLRGSSISSSLPTVPGGKP